jgi:hypothetical protein
MESTISSLPSAEPAVLEPWVLRLREAYDAGYYRTEAAISEQSTFPWQGKTCRDCPFWGENVCRVFDERRSGVAHTCCYFDEANRSEAESMLHSRG